MSKNRKGKNLQTFNTIDIIDIRLSSTMVIARSLRKRKIPCSNPTVGKNFSFLNSRSTCVDFSTGS